MQDVFGALFELQREYLEHVRHALGDDSAHPRQGPILGLLLAADGVSQADLMRKLGVSAATVAVSVARLERLGYVRRERNQRNQRANVLALTEAGRAQAERLQQAICLTCGDALEGIAEEELACFTQVLAQMTRNLKCGSTFAAEEPRR
ncbi:MAG TPA: MarR family winged helix-turn-helix transcriptional regulator [Candidatus Limiplasma sp.]|nr:MarR family winged helix-turn-helix transcriptional regulator [Candidatus Limiplasma sp.]HPS82287.1 MarR family winged helix-turn-helix transcriptional regulator [Candidatus Limiplasma sp.]